MNFKNKQTFFLVVALSAGFAKAQDDKAQFEENKAKAIKHLEDRASNIQEAKTCASAASDRDALRDCFKNLHAKQSDMRMDFMEKRQDRMGKRMERMQKKLDAKKAKEESAASVPGANP